MATADANVRQIDDLRLAMMPLSGITHVAGVEGLHRRLELEVDAFDPDAKRLVSRSVEIASALFVGDEYKGLPYMTHLLRVAIRLIRDYAVTDVDVVAAAILHDSIEDHPKDLVALLGSEGQTAVEALGSTIGERAAQFVAALSNEPSAPGRSVADKIRAYRDGIEKKVAMSYEVFLVKLSDFTDNACGLHWGEDNAKTVKVAPKYLPTFPVFFDAIDRYVAIGAMPQRHAEIAREMLTTGQSRCKAFTTTRLGE